MAFVNLSLLLGGLLIGVPIVLHLIMRQQPKHFVFPALRFVQQRRESNRRSLQLRHWILLALRCLLILLLAVALARPSVAAAAWSDWAQVLVLLAALLLLGVLTAYLVFSGRSRMLAATSGALTFLLLIGTGFLAARAWSASRGAPIGDREAPVAAVLLVDSSWRMQYRHANQTRLEQAREMGQAIVRQLPAGSEVAVLDSRPGQGVFSVDVSAAAAALGRLQPVAVAEPLSERLEEALRLVQTQPERRQEIYVLTDLSRSAWAAPSPQALKHQLEAAEQVLLYIVDVGVENPRNVAITNLRLAQQNIPRSSPLDVEVEVRSVGESGSHVVELYIEDPEPSLPVIRDGKTEVPPARRRSQTTVELQPGQAQWVHFQVSGLDVGVHQGWVRVVGEDGLAEDNVRHFTFEVQQAWPVLVVRGPGATDRFFVEAIAPFSFRTTGEARFNCETIRQEELGSKVLSEYAAVCLLDPTPVAEDMWRQLLEYVEQGGSLAAMLGHNASPEAFSGELAQRVLGGRIVRQWRSGGSDWFLAPSSYDHPILAIFRNMADGVPWQQFPVYRHWEMDDLAASARVPLRYSNGQPAIVEHELGRGRVLTMTTPVSDPARPEGRPAWNELPTAPDAWPYLVLANEMMLYLVGSGNTSLNLLTGETAILPIDPTTDPQRYQLFTPRDEVSEVVAQDDQLSIRYTDWPGAYRLKGFRGEPVILGFSANIPGEQLNLQRLEDEQLAEVLGEQRYEYANDLDEIQRVQGTQRVGQEFYPLLLVLFALALGLEQLLANRFYPSQGEAGTPNERAGLRRALAPAGAGHEPQAPVVAGKSSPPGRG